jgi:hypothetical protein
VCVFCVSFVLLPIIDEVVGSVQSKHVEKPQRKVRNLRAISKTARNRAHHEFKQNGTQKKNEQMSEQSNPVNVTVQMFSI